MCNRYRAFSFTWNNPPEDPTFPPSRHLCYGKEVAPTTGTPHLQGAIYFPDPKTLSAAIKCLPGCHVEIALDYHALVTYCKKDGDVTETGELPATQEIKGKRGREATEAIWESAREAAKCGDFDAIPASIYLRCKRACHEISREHMVAPPDAAGVTGLWLWGPPGSGKSRRARELFPGIFDKACNKWWDGYQGGPILLDDFDMSHRALGHHLKRWADRYAFTGETKGGVIFIRPERVVVTSNYSISQIFSEDAVLSEALTRRFECVHVDFNPITNPQPRYFGLGIYAY